MLITLILMVVVSLAVKYLFKSGKLNLRYDFLKAFKDNQTIPLGYGRENPTFSDEKGIELHYRK